MRLPDVKIPRPLAILLCLSPLIPEVLIPGTGALALFALTFLMLIISKDVRDAAWRWVPQSVGREIAIGVALGVAIAGLTWVAIDPLIEPITGTKVDFSAFKDVEGNILNTLILLAVGWVVGGFAEEVTHRGYVIGWGSRLLGEKWEIPLLLLVSTAFGVAHLYQGLAGAISAGMTGLLPGDHLSQAQEDPSGTDDRARDDRHVWYRGIVFRLRP